jgi:hypothetical protein
VRGIGATFWIVANRPLDFVARGLAPFGRQGIIGHRGRMHWRPRRTHEYTPSNRLALLSTLVTVGVIVPDTARVAIAFSFRRSVPTGLSITGRSLGQACAVNHTRPRRSRRRDAPTSSSSPARLAVSDCDFEHLKSGGSWTEILYTLIKLTTIL